MRDDVALLMQERAWEVTHEGAAIDLSDIPDILVIPLMRHLGKREVPKKVRPSLERRLVKPRAQAIRNAIRVLDDMERDDVALCLVDGEEADVFMSELVHQEIGQQSRSGVASDCFRTGIVVKNKDQWLGTIVGKMDMMMTMTVITHHSESLYSDNRLLQSRNHLTRNGYLMLGRHFGLTLTDMYLADLARKTSATHPGIADMIINESESRFMQTVPVASDWLLGHETIRRAMIKTVTETGMETVRDMPFVVAASITDWKTFATSVSGDGRERRRTVLMQAYDAGSLTGFLERVGTGEREIIDRGGYHEAVTSLVTGPGPLFGDWSDAVDLHIIDVESLDDIPVLMFTDSSTAQQLTALAKKSNRHDHGFKTTVHHAIMHMFINEHGIRVDPSFSETTLYRTMLNDAFLVFNIEKYVLKLTSFRALLESRAESFRHLKDMDIRDFSRVFLDDDPKGKSLIETIREELSHD
jgi:hypothetical protein